LNLREQNPLINCSEGANLINSEKKLLSVGVITFVIFSFITLKFNPGFAGARDDSYFYLKMFNYIKSQDTLIPLAHYQVATSPIFVSLIGGLQIVSGSFFTIIIHLFYLCFALLSIFFFIQILDSNRFLLCLSFVILFSSSGYFVAPSIWPTSDAPAILFAILTIYMLQRRRYFGFAAVSFLLVSTRQNFAWLLLAMFFYECLAEIKFSIESLKKLIKYIPALFSLSVTFIYFGGHLSTPSYLSNQSENSYPLPNFLNSIQIGITLLSFLGALALILNSESLVFNLGSRFFTILSGFAFFPMCFLLTNSKHPLVEGLGWISLLSLKLHVSLIVIALLATIGLALSFFLAFQKVVKVSMLPTSMLASLLLFTLLMPIPFLRYFEFSLILITSMLTMNLDRSLLSTKSYKYVAVSIFFLVLNASKIFS